MDLSRATREAQPPPRRGDRSSQRMGTEIPASIGRPAEAGRSRAFSVQGQEVSLGRPAGGANAGGRPGPVWLAPLVSQKSQTIRVSPVLLSRTMSS